MPRIVTVKPSFHRDRELYLLDRETKLPVRLTYQALWSIADCEGRIRWRPEEFKYDVAPYEKEEDFQTILALLVDKGKVELYEVDHETYAFIPSLPKHQKKDANRNPEWPAPPSTGRLSSQKREQIAKLQAAGKMKNAEICARFGIGISTLQRIQKEFKPVLSTIHCGKRELKRIPNPSSIELKSDSNLATETGRSVAEKSLGKERKGKELINSSITRGNPPAEEPDVFANEKGNPDPDRTSRLEARHREMLRQRAQERENEIAKQLATRRIGES